MRVLDSLPRRGMFSTFTDHGRGVVKGIFMIRERPIFFPVKREMACFFSRES